jgi:hypothetical protein
MKLKGNAAVVSVRLAVFYVFIVVSSQLFAQTGDEVVVDDSKQHLENVEKMLLLMGVPSDVDRAAEGAMQLYSAKVTDKEADRITQEIVEAYQRDLRTIVMAVLSWEALKPNYINTYASLMSEDDVTQTLVFLESAVGQKYLQSQQQATVQIQEITSHLAQEDMAPLLIDLTKKLRDALTKVQTAIQNKKNQ